MRLIWKILKRLIFIGLGLILLLAILGGSVLFWIVRYPDSARRFAENHLLPADLRVTWERVDAGFQWTGGLSWRFHLQGTNISISKGQPQVQVPLSELSTDVSLAFFQRRPIVHVSHLRVLAQKPLQLRLDPSPEVTDEEPKSLYQQIESYLRLLALGKNYAQMDSAEIRIPEFRFARGEEPPTVLAIHLKRPAEGKSTDTLMVKLGAQRERLKAQLDGALNFAELESEQPFMEGRLKADGAGAKVDALFKASYTGTKIDLRVSGNVAYALKGKMLQLAPQVALIMTREEADVRLETAVAGLVPTNAVDVKKITGHVRWGMRDDTDWLATTMSFRIWAPVELYLVDKDMRPPLEKACECKIPERLMVTLNGKFWPKTLMELKAHRRPVVDGRIQVEGVRNKLFNADLAAQVRVDREGEEWKIFPTLDSTLHIQSYQGLRRYLDAKGLIIPAPLDVLNGEIHIEAQSQVTRTSTQSRTPVHVAVNLASPNQKVDLQITTTLVLDSELRNLDVFVDVLVNALELELPPLDPIAGLPKVISDPRFLFQPPPSKQAKVAAKGKAQGFKVRFYFAAQTASPGVVKLLSKYADPFIPLTLNLKRSLSGDLDGFVKIEPFEIHYLRRTVHVEQLRVVMPTRDDANIPVDGRFRVNQTQYRIFVDVSGTLRAPSIKLSSDPYLPRSEIISVLLYDRTTDQLAGGDTDAVGNFEAALADRAIGLFGLWAFASTPIRSFSYNAVTKVYSATVNLGGGVTATVGTTWEEAAHLEVRKRVSKRWVLTASWDPNQETERAGQLVLQWEKRF
ncbi:MAG: translocation/assembly module TamB domain-containing protein [Bdellovibrionales bacterium]